MFDLNLIDAAAQAEPVCIPSENLNWI